MAIVRTIYAPDESPILFKLRVRDKERADKMIAAYYTSLRKRKIKKPCANMAKN